ncbi:Endonuclease/exonuclease/phosphatase [Xylariaceae sp. FL1272]|nr:Endonuclease/exonuclease/phosphatase [Xylariaceae sp. FL1272]
MSWLSSIRTQYLSWSRDTPLPSLSDAAVEFQSWHRFNSSTSSWIRTKWQNTVHDTQQSSAKSPATPSPLVLLTWNIDATAKWPELRTDAILSHILSLESVPDIVFLQEVPRASLHFLMKNSRVRKNWFLSEVDESAWRTQSFATVTLLSNSKFSDGSGGPNQATIGPVWRVRCPSRFHRDALCCDIFVPAGNDASKIRIRLINVHLDSLPIQPSQRPRQVAIVASLLRCTGRGVVAGDFDPVLPEDDALVKDNGLLDVWAELRGDEPGFTWGSDGKQPFPPNRLDKVAIVGLRASSIDIVSPGSITENNLGNISNDHSVTDVDDCARSQQDTKPRADSTQWSDHSGLVFCFDTVLQ